MAEMSPLRRRLIEDMNVRRFSPATKQSTSARFRSSPVFRPLAGPARIGRRPRLPGAFNLERRSWASLNQVVCALRFFYGVTLGCDAIPARMAYARTRASCRPC